MGFRPIVLERGKPVRERTQDTWGLWRKSVLNPASNVQFGEGGAGLFSDGKLYSQVKDPKFHGRKVLHEFVKRSEEHTSELQSLMRISYAVFCLTTKKNKRIHMQTY